MQKQKRVRRAKPARILTESEREYLVQGHLDLATEPRRILRFEFLCVTIGAFVMMLPFLIHTLLPALVPGPFAQTPPPAAVWSPVVALAVLAVAFLYANRRKSGESPDTLVLRSIKRAPLFLSAVSVVMILTGTSDLQRQFNFGRRVAVYADSRSRDSHTSPEVIDATVLAMVAIVAATGFMSLYARVVIKPSWLYQHALKEKMARLNPQEQTAPRTVADENRETVQIKLSEAIEKADLALFRVLLLSAVMYAAIGTSACLYFAFGRQRYLHDPVAASFGQLAYVLNLILVGEGFRVWLINLWHRRAAGAPDAQLLSDKCVRVLKWSLSNAAVALVYVWLLIHGGLDKGADLLIKHVIPGWSALQAWIFSNIIAVFALGVLSSLIASRIDRFFAQRRRKRRRASRRVA